MAQTGGGGGKDPSGRWFVSTSAPYQFYHATNSAEEQLYKQDVQTGYLLGPYKTEQDAKLAVSGKGIHGHTQWYVIPNPGWPFDVGVVPSILGVSGKYALEQSASAPSGTVAGPFGTKSAANNWINQHGGALGVGNIPNPLSGISSIGDFFGRLSEASTWVRVGEVALGLALVIIGMSRLSHHITDPTAKKILGTVNPAAKALGVNQP